MQYLIELLIFLTFIIIPPIFTPKLTEISPIEFSLYSVILYGIITLYCFIRVKDLKKATNTYKHSNTFFSKKHIITKHKFLKNLVLSIFTLIFLFLNGRFWQWISNSPTNKLPNNTSIFWHIFQVFGIFIYAFYEENMYRSFLPLSLEINLEFITKTKNHLKLIFAICEILALLLFSFGHLYMGIFAVLNAFFAGIALRFLVWKTKSVFPSTIIHFIYNLVLYLSMFTKA